MVAVAVNTAGLLSLLSREFKQEEPLSDHVSSWLCSFSWVCVKEHAFACTCCIWTPGFAQSLSVWLNAQTVVSSLAPVCPDLCPVSILLNMLLFNVLQVFADFLHKKIHSPPQQLCFPAISGGGEIHIQLNEPFKEKLMDIIFHYSSSWTNLNYLWRDF